MGIIERQTLEKEREHWKRAINAEKEAVAAGDLSLDEFSSGDPRLPTVKPCDSHFARSSAFIHQRRKILSFWLISREFDRETK